MHDAGGVDGLEHVAQPRGEAGELRRRHGSVGPYVLLEVVAVDELGHHEGLGRVDLGVEHGGDRGVPQPLQRGDLTTQPVPGDRVRADVGVQQLEGDRLPAAVDRAIHGPHPARAEGRDDPVPADLRAGRQAHPFHENTLAAARSVARNGAPSAGHQRFAITSREHQGVMGERRRL